MLEIKGKYCKDVKIFTDNIEDTALATLYGIADCAAFKDKKIRIMPDVHDGKGVVIGFSCPIDIENDHVNPQTVGCDIGCTISATFFDKPIINDKMKEFEHKIRKEIPFGFDINKKSKVEWKRIAKAVNSAMNRLCALYPSFTDYAITFLSENDLEKWCDRVRIDYGTFLKSIGSVGGGELIATVWINSPQ